MLSTSMVTSAHAHSAWRLDALSSCLAAGMHDPAHGLLHLGEKLQRLCVLFLTGWAMSSSGFRAANYCVLVAQASSPSLSPRRAPSASWLRKLHDCVQKGMHAALLRIFIELAAMAALRWPILKRQAVPCMPVRQPLPIERPN